MRTGSVPIRRRGPTSASTPLLMPVDGPNSGLLESDADASREEEVERSRRSPPHRRLWDFGSKGATTPDESAEEEADRSRRVNPRRLWNFSSQGRSSSVGANPNSKLRGKTTFTRVATQFEKQRARIKEELEGWRRHFRAHGSWNNGHQAPKLVSLEPIVSCSEDGFHERRVQYRAMLSLVMDSTDHNWQTEPFTLDELLAVVVSARRAQATRWCLDNTNHLPIMGDATEWRHHGLKQAASTIACAIRGASFWCLVLWLASRITALIRPWVYWLLTTWSLAAGVEPSAAGFPDWILSFMLACLNLVTMTALLAGISEMSFLPAKAILQLERKAETEKVRAQLMLLLKGGDCLKDLSVCNFLGLGMATYYNSSETQKEGRCFCRRHESAEDRFRRTARRRLSLFCCSLEWRLRTGRDKGLRERWLVLRKDGIGLFASILDKDPTDMLLFDTSFALFRDDDNRVLIHGASWVLELEFTGASQSNVQAWCNAITVTAQLSPRTRQQRFGSFAPLRFPAQAKAGDRHMLRRSLAKFLINGRATFRTIAEAILLAEHEIFILSFFMSPHMSLVREGDPLPNNEDPRLSSLLRGAADRGVRVCVVLFHETMLPNDSDWAEAGLKHQNIYVVRHRSQWDSNRLWTHHEKVVVVDQQLAIIGGLDLCVGRYDDCRHRLCDTSASIWEGQDYYNPRIKDIADGRRTGDIFDRQKNPRLPWQDIACVVLGRAARDMARHCVERWNHAKSKRPQYCSMPTALLQRKVAVCNDRIVALLQSKTADSSWPAETGKWEECTAQVVRSVGRWSAGTKTESSLHQAICDSLQDAERFVYIENQFFCSGLDGNDVIGNRVAEALYRRIVMAHSERQTFHVMMVLPLLGAFEAPIAPASTSQPVICVMKAQYMSLRALRQRLLEAGVCMSDYVSVFGLRTHDNLPAVGPVTEQVYVHSKAMIIDDRLACIGSANFNDRSLLGMRDSEVNVVLQGSGFASGLRKALFAQHLGWTREQLEVKFADPANPEAIAEVRQIARRNTAAYEELFGAIPSDQVRTWAELANRRGASQTLRDYTKSPSSEEVANALSREPIQGFLVEFPLDFLADEDLTSSTGSLLQALFT